MWSNVGDALTVRTALANAKIGDTFTFRALDYANALDRCCDNWGEDDVFVTLQDKLRHCHSDFIASLVLYGNIAPITVYRDGTEWVQGNGHHRLAVLAHWGMTVNVVVGAWVHTHYDALPYGVMVESFGPGSRE